MLLALKESLLSMNMEYLCKKRKRCGKHTPSLIRKGGLEILLSVELKILLEKCKFLEQVKEIVQLSIKRET